MGPCKLLQDEVEQLLGSDALARLATNDDAGYPHITPVWFHWDGTTIRITSLRSKPHLTRSRKDPQVCVLVDAEEPDRSDGQRPNHQVRMIGDAQLVDDVEGVWTRLITHRYLTGPGAEATAERRAAADRVVIENPADQRRRYRLRSSARFATTEISSSRPWPNRRCPSDRSTWHSPPEATSNQRR